MLLYAKTTSERASNGQGGNKHILTILTAEIDGERQEIASVSAVLYNNTVIGDYYNIEIITPSHKVIKEKLSINTKGEKKKSEVMPLRAVDGEWDIHN